MSFERLTAFAKKVADELNKAGVPQTPTGADIAGWCFNTQDVQETTLHGPSINTELKFESDELWLGVDGRLWLVQVTKYTVIGRLSGSSNTEYFTVTPLTEEYARKRDGRSEWHRWVDKRGGGARADMNTLQFKPPSATYPPLASVSSLLSKIRPS
jgi:hypothetical protein